MTRLTEVARQALAAEKAAREAEGIYSPTATQKALLRKRTVLAARVKALSEEVATIESIIEKEMREKDIRAIHENGVNLALISPTTRTVTYVAEDRMTEQFPEVVAAYKQYQQIVPLFTTKVKEPNGDSVRYQPVR